jgi:UTP--glucose-1-phosphate uridylyltransferase
MTLSWVLPVGIINIGKIQLADPINTQAANNTVLAVMLNRRRFDCGCVEGYLNSIMHAAKSREK